ncbi:restriction endonuclease [Bifidobacterium platyrrhinorum]|uniref:Restriction endonuclease type IV Mrr domain-containing protein n=1 Tax=Bifidobacterium platyrrhinorum TaxID=2661628 RepID=A0A6L9SRE4_9BIFI|nr:restriction endonuclease [Bifidobacterium platyrrhinorum]NEG54745.1 hypothetical protein [Bifidobacterium platyrrhinorum]
MTQALRPEVIIALKETLLSAFWYKNDLKHFLMNCGISSKLIAQLDWDDPKRVILGQLIDGMAQKQAIFGDDLRRLAISTAGLSDPTWLKKVKDTGEQKYAEGVRQLDSFRNLLKPLIQQDEQRRIAEENKRRYAERLIGKANMDASLKALNADFQKITKKTAQEKGYALEQFLPKLFDAFDIESRGSYKIDGEQIDGAFVLNNTNFLLEAKWHSGKIDKPDVTVFAEKVGSKLDNTLGLLISMNGFTDRAIHNSGARRPNVLLMDGPDIAAVLERRIDLPALIEGKRSHASQTGEIMISAWQLPPTFNY